MTAVEVADDAGLSEREQCEIEPMPILPYRRILDVPVSAMDIESAVSTIEKWIGEGASHFVCIRDVHGVMRAQADPELMALHEEAGMVTPDGMPLVWLSRLKGAKTVSRVCGADLVDALCEGSRKKGYGLYLYGGKPGVAELMAARLAERWPGVRIVGTDTPPFRALSLIHI